MLRLCSKSSRSYPGRLGRHAVRMLTASDTATYRVIGQESAEVILLKCCAKFKSIAVIRYKTKVCRYSVM